MSAPHEPEAAFPGTDLLAGDVARLLLGSVPDQVMRKANCPVLAVHPGHK